MFFADAAADLEGYRITSNGYLVADVRFARTGIQDYAGNELDRRDLPLVHVFRSDAEVFASAAMRSFAGRPVTLGHPADMVASTNWRKHAVGRVDDEIKRDGAFVRANIIVQDGAAIDMIRNGTRELSAGYQCEIQWQAGSTADGKAYQALQTAIRGNHVAIVDRARAGQACRIGLAA